MLISPFSVTNADWQAKRLDVALTKKQVENSPNIDTHRPVSRQYETEYLGYYGYPILLGRILTCGDQASYPAAMATRNRILQGSAGGKDPERVDGFASAQYRSRHWLSHRGYWMAKSAMWQGLSWTMKPGLSATLRWQRAIGGRARRYWFHPRGFNEVSWADSKVYVGLYREAIQTAPVFVESVPLTREYEDQLHLHYGRPPYWVHEGEHESVFFPERRLSEGAWASVGTRVPIIFTN